MTFITHRVGGRTSPVASVRPPPRIPTHMVGGVRSVISRKGWFVPLRLSRNDTYYVLVTLVLLTRAHPTPKSQPEGLCFNHEAS